MKESDRSLLFPEGSLLLLLPVPGFLGASSLLRFQKGLLSILENSFMMVSISLLVWGITFSWSVYFEGTR